MDSGGDAGHKSGKQIEQFADAAAFEAWLDIAGPEHPGIWMKISKKGAEVGTVSYKDAVDCALIFGWIDGQKGSFDTDYYLQMFTPRRPRSIWSQRNVGRVAELLESGRM